MIIWRMAYFSIYYHPHTSTTSSLYCLNRSSVVTRCSGSLIACAV
jgi:hypothetical protein